MNEQAENMISICVCYACAYPASYYAPYFDSHIYNPFSRKYYKVTCSLEYLLKPVYFS